MDRSLFYVLPSQDGASIKLVCGDYDGHGKSKDNWVRFDIQPDRCALDDLRALLITHPAAHGHEDWTRQLHKHSHQYSESFFDNLHKHSTSDLRWLDSKDPDAPVVFCIPIRLIDDPESLKKTLSMPLEILEKYSRTSASDALNWIEGLLPLRRPIEFWLCRDGQTDNQRYDSRPFVILIESVDSDPSNGSGFDDKLSKHLVAKIKEYLHRCGGDAPRILEGGAKGRDWWLHSNEKAKQTRRTDLGAIDLVWLRNPPKDKITAILECSPPNRRIILHFMGKVRSNGLELYPQGGKASTINVQDLRTCFSSRTVDLLYIGTCHAKTDNADLPWSGRSIREPAPFARFLTDLLAEAAEHISTLISFRWSLEAPVIVEIANIVYDRPDGDSNRLLDDPTFVILEVRSKMLANLRTQVDDRMQTLAADYRYAWLAPVLFRCVSHQIPESLLSDRTQEAQKELKDKLQSWCNARVKEIQKRKAREGQNESQKTQLQKLIADLLVWQREVEDRIDACTAETCLQSLRDELCNVEKISSDVELQNAIRDLGANRSR